MTLTFVGIFNANGDIVYPGIIYPYVKVPDGIASSVPDDFFMGKSESGWMKAEVFYEYVANGSIPWVREHKIPLPVILFVDGHTTHLSPSVSTLCENNNIILYLLPPNTTHILQPADVGAFRTLKLRWRNAVHEFQRENLSTIVRRCNVATGLCPLDPDRPDYCKCLDASVEEPMEENSTKANARHSVENANDDAVETPQNFSGTVSDASVTFQFLKHAFGDKVVSQLDNFEGFMPETIYSVWKMIKDSVGNGGHAQGKEREININSCGIIQENVSFVVQADNNFLLNEAENDLSTIELDETVVLEIKDETIILDENMNPHFSIKL